MSEMLGNRYLLELRFQEAIPQFESRLRRAPRDRRTAEKLALCYALSGNPQAAARWLRLALEAGTAESRSEDALWRELASLMQSRSEELGTLRSAVGLSLAQLFRSPPAGRELVDGLVDTPETAWLREVVIAFERRLEAPDDTTH